MGDFNNPGALAPPIVNGLSDGSVTTAKIANHGLGTVTVPGAYPYTAGDDDGFVPADSGGGARRINLPDGTTYAALIVADAGDNASANNVTIGLANAAKKLNGTVNGTVVISTNGQQKGFWRDTSGNWHGGA